MAAKMTEKQYARYLDQVRQHKQAWKSAAAPHGYMRMGQSYFNVLHMYWPDIADSIRATEFDPFYDDGKIGDFLNHLYANHVAPCCRNCRGHN